MAQYLWLGCQGPEVKQAQQALNRAGGTQFAKLSEDGIFGQLTLARVKEFQASRGLTADGIIGPLTRAALGMPVAAGGPSAVKPTLPPLQIPKPEVQQSFAGKLINAVGNAMTSWKKSVSFVGIQIAGPTAVGGSLVGPPLAPFIGVVDASDMQKIKITSAVTAVTSAAFLQWAGSVKVPGLPWYPAFAAFPGPVAPPQPNVPSPLVAMTQVVGIMASPDALASTYAAAAGTDSATRALLAEVAQGVSTRFNVMTASTMIINVIGQGPVPTFAPPMVPVGPVVGGTAVGPPGCLS